MDIHDDDDAQVAEKPAANSDFDAEKQEGSATAARTSLA